MNEITFRAVMDDGSIIEWEDPLTLEDGTEKLASIDDIDRSKLSNLLTLDYTGKVLHSLGFSPEDRKTKLAIWRCVREIKPTDDTPVTAGALSGYNELHSDGTTSITLDFISSDGTITKNTSQECSLHPRELFSDLTS